ncbi:MAG TPA: hypothetical protein VGR64_10920 [Terracidiphilus sp.]|nr:hypothetical protein [Terracidiphilus sp.]
MPAIARTETYRSAIDEAITELNQISSMMEGLYERKTQLERATEGLKHLLGTMDPRMQAGMSGMPTGREMDPRGGYPQGGQMPMGNPVPQSDFPPVVRFPERAD